ncbi:hypothetical protein [Aeromonas sobria]|nr:hypothetical protein [Aeromonas sobria]
MAPLSLLLGQIGQMILPCHLPAIEAQVASGEKEQAPEMGACLAMAR